MNSKLRKALERHANWAHRWGKDSPDTYIYGTHNFKPMTLETVEAEKAIRKAVAEEMLELLEHPHQILIQIDDIEYLNGGYVSLVELREKIKEWSER